ncbi:MAG TPA: hypothetical protein VK858_17450 [Longimicrobiales bacterium]|nr:hypothetical protein [Longimicrobiales bacterium]
MKRPLSAGFTASAALLALVACTSDSPTAVNELSVGAPMLSTVDGAFCTRTAGYWKTHNPSGTAAREPDATWELIQPSAETSQFFLSGQTWVDVLGTPARGNPYYILAQQYIAAYLNRNNVNFDLPAAPPEVDAALAAAQGLFAVYTPAAIGGLTGNDPLRGQFLGLADILGSYNEGESGPGRCPA